VILPASILAWTPEQLEELDERAALVADGCRLPQRCEEADRRAEEVVRARWERLTGTPIPSPPPARPT
jgi:hypothetical protein